MGTTTKPQREIVTIQVGNEILEVEVPVGMSDDEIRRQVGGAPPSQTVRIPRSAQQDPRVGPTGRLLERAETGLREFGLGAAETLLPGGEHIALPTGQELRALASPFSTAKELGSMTLEGVGGLLSMLTGASPPTPQMARARTLTGDTRNTPPQEPPLTLEEVAHSTGKAAGLAAGLMVPGTKGGRALAGGAIDEVAGLGKTLTTAKPKAFTVAADELMKAVKPPKGLRLRFKEVAPDATRDVADFAKTFNMPIESVYDAGRATTAAKRALFDDLEAIVGQQAAIDGNNIVAALERFKEGRKVRAFKGGETVSDLPPGLKDPSDLIDEYIQFYKDKRILLRDAENLRIGENARMQSFMKKNQVAQGKELKANAVTGSQLEVIQALEQEIESVLSKAKSPGVKELRKRYSNLRTMEDAFMERYLSELVDTDIGLLQFDSLDTITAGSSVSALALGQPAAAATLGATVLARRAIDVLRERLGKPDRLVRKAFEDVEAGEFRRTRPPQRRLLPAPRQVITPESPRQPIPAAGERSLRSISGQR